LNAVDNIAIGRGELAVDLKQVIEAATLSGIHSKIRTWDSYYETRLGTDTDDAECSCDECISNDDVKNYSTDDDDDDDQEEEEKSDLPSSKSEPEEPVPFKFKVFRQDLHYKNKVRGKPLTFYSYDDDDDQQKLIPPEIPAWSYGMEPIKQRIHHEWLSGGQWQKVAMARAFMKIRDVELLILDEPSSALDPQAEYEVFKTLMELRRGKTTIFIVPEPDITVLVC
jgi:hypothetical protein